MAIKFFKKLMPNNPVVVILDDERSPGQKAHVPIEFTSLDGIVGWYATDQTAIQQQFESFMRQQRYGISEVSEQEFHEQYVSKKNQTERSPKSWREEISRSSGAAKSLGQEPVARLGSEYVRDAVRVNATDGKPKSAQQIPVAVAEVPATKPAPVNTEFKPNVGKRMKPKGS